MQRRQFLLAGCATGAAVVAGRWYWHEKLLPPVQIDRVGMQAGHVLRQPLQGAFPLRGRYSVVIVGSGIAGLTAAWQLQKQGVKDFLLVGGPEWLGNAAAGRSADGLLYPKGAHYLPFPSMASTHVRELLAEMGVCLADAYQARPLFDEAAILHAPDERVFDVRQGKWHAGLWQAGSLAARQEIERFFQLMASLKEAKGADGRRHFEIPISMRSTDPQWHSLDHMTFAQWLAKEGFRSSELFAYLDYACRDDYGAGIETVSAWAGVHYFVGRDGHAANAADGGLLTWPDGLGHVAGWMRQQIPASAQQSGMAVKIVPSGTDVRVYLRSGQQQWQVQAERVICATPLHVTKHLLPLADFGYDPLLHQPVRAPWLVSNFFLDRFPDEKEGEGLAWDNVVAGSQGLGYVVATHQWIRQYRPEKTIFTAYRTLPDQSPMAARRWLEKASADDLLAAAMIDLSQVYDRKTLLRALSKVEVTVRAHAMAIPTPGFLANEGLQRLRTQKGRVLFAHADLSGYSVFEEAAWWGYQAAQTIIKGS